MVLMEWTDHSRRRFESWRISIFYRKWLQNTENQWLPCFWLSSFDRYSRHNCHYVACFRPLLHRSIVASFSIGPSRDQPRKPRGERGGERGGFHPARWRFLLGAASARTFLSRTRPGKRKGEVFTLGLPFHSC